MSTNQNQTLTTRPITRRKPLKANVNLKKGGPTATAIARMLADQSLNYAEIAQRVRLALPGAQTSSRSVASVASQLRRDGYRVPDRRVAV